MPEGGGDLGPRDVRQGQHREDSQSPEERPLVLRHDPHGVSSIENAAPERAANPLWRKLVMSWKTATAAARASAICRRSTALCRASPTSACRRALRTAPGPVPRFG